MTYSIKGAVLAAFSVFVLGACTQETAVQDQPKAAQPEFSADRIKADMLFLADDMLEGREAGTDGHEMAAKYVAAEMAKLGLKPHGTDGYFQRVTFKKAAVDMKASSASITLDGEASDLVQGKDVVIAPTVASAEADASGAFVFVGYGVSAPGEGHDDLAGVDLAGKIVLYLGGAPEGLHSEIRSHYRSSRPKLAEFGKRGAAGALRVMTTKSMGRFTFEQWASFLARPTTRWVAPEGSNAGPAVAVSGVISEAMVEKIFAAEGLSLADAEAQVLAGTPTTPVTFKATGDLKRRGSLEVAFTSPNVVGVIEGTDLADEYVVITAHLDHVGVREHPRFDDTDKVHNGAMDNASGIATMLEVARAYALNGKKPRRSILMAAVTAEEKGLQGAAFFAHYPTVPVTSMVANVNLDMPILLYDFQDVVAFGAARSEIGTITEAALAKVGVTLSEDPIPEQTLFVRSDHYEFVKQGIPSVFLMTGFLDTPDGVNGGEIFNSFIGGEGYYHSPKDDMDQPIRFDVAAKFAKVNFFILDEIANRDKRPAWNDGDFFGTTFAQGSLAVGSR